MWTELIQMAATLLGVAFMFVSAVGVYRLPDFYLRIHALTKATTIGLLCLLIAVAISVQERTVVTKAILTVLFIGSTAPVGAHLLARAAYRNGVPSSGEPEVDEYGPAVAEGRLRADAEPRGAADLQ